MNTWKYEFPFAPLACSIALTVLMSCQMDDTKQWNNPADPDGTNYHAPRVSVESDSLFVDSSRVELRVVATSPNAKIAKVQWSVDGRAAATVPFKSSDSVMNLHVPGVQEAPHVVAVHVQDETGLWSAPDTVRLRVWNEPPKLVKVRDTTLSTRRTLSVELVATDIDGKVAGYLVDTSGGRRDGIASAQPLRIALPSEGAKTVVWGARDDLGKMTLDTFVVRFTEKPVATPVEDTSLSASKTLSVALVARDVDPAGKIVKYLWSTSGSGWTDSSDQGSLRVANSVGGIKQVRWAVRNDQGKLSAEDTFSVSFVPAPTIASVAIDNSFRDWTGTNGTLSAAWSGSVPGFASEPLTWTLRFGVEGSVSQVYQGPGTSWSMTEGDTGKTFQYELVAKNRFGDSVKTARTVRAHGPQPKTSYGIPWNTAIIYGYFTDKRDNQGYFTVTIGSQTWMAQNLNYAGSGTTVGACYNNSVDSCSKYGRLYTWSEAMKGATSSASSPSGVQGICPEGWHVPSDAEWQSLEISVGMTSSVAAMAGRRGTAEGAKFKSIAGWNYSGNGTDVYGFRVLPAGYVNAGSSDDAGSHTIFWSTSEDDAPYCWTRAFSYGYASTYRSNSDKTYGVSLRCLRN